MTAGLFRDRSRLSALVLCLAMYLSGLAWGLPARFHPDEKAGTVVRMIEGRTVVPDSFINPSLPLFAMAPAVVAQTVATDVGLIDGVAANSVLACRFQSAIAAVLSILLFGEALTRFGGSAFVPMFALALMPAVVNFSHFATPESWLMLGWVGTLCLCLAYVDGKSRATWLGLALGLTVSCKYTALALGVPVALSVLLRRTNPEKPSRWWLLLLPLVGLLGLLLCLEPGSVLASRLEIKGDARLLRPESALSFVREAGAWAIGVSVLGVLARPLTLGSRPGLLPLLCQTGVFATIGFVLGTPGSLVSPVRFLSDVAFNAQTRFGYKGFVSTEGSWGAYAGLLVDAAGWPICLAAAIGLIVKLRGARGMDAKSWVLLVAGLAPFVLIAASGHRAMRFLVPVLPTVAWLSAVGVGAIPSMAWKRGATALLLVATFVQSVLLLRLFHVDSRLEAASWLKARMRADETWGLISNFQGYGPQLESASRDRALRTLSRELAPAPVFVGAANDLLASGPDWLVVPDLYFGRFVDRPEVAPERSKFFSDLLAGRWGYTLSAEFQQPASLRPPNEFLDPLLLVFRRLP